MRAPPDTLVTAPQPSAPPSSITPAVGALRCLTVDVEEYFHIEAAHDVVARGEWDRWPSRVEGHVELLLEMLARHGVRGTFFFLGDVARRNKGLAARVSRAGHEIASHGTNHDRLHRLDPAAFRSDLTDSRKLLEDQTGQGVVGYRAPTFSLVPQTAWAIDVLSEGGFTYDSSIFPVHHPAYGVPTAPDRPFLVCGHAGGPTLLEVPPLTLRFRIPGIPGAGAGRNLAVAGGGYFRLLPLALMQMGLNQAAAQDRPAVLYFHPWEFDPGMPRLPLGVIGRWRTYTGLSGAARRLERIIRQPARWLPLGSALPELRAGAEGHPIFDLSTLVYKIPEHLPDGTPPGSSVLAWAW